MWIEEEEVGVSEKKQQALKERNKRARKQNREKDNKIRWTRTNGGGRGHESEV